MLWLVKLLEPRSLENPFAHFRSKMVISPWCLHCRPAGCSDMPTIQGLEGIGFVMRAKEKFLKIVLHCLLSMLCFTSCSSQKLVSLSTLPPDLFTRTHDESHGDVWWKPPFIAPTGTKTTYHRVIIEGLSCQPTPRTKRGEARHHRRVGVPLAFEVSWWIGLKTRIDGACSACVHCAISGCAAISFHSLWKVLTSHVCLKPEWDESKPKNIIHFLLNMYIKCHEKKKKNLKCRVYFSSKRRIVGIIFGNLWNSNIFSTGCLRYEEKWCQLLCNLPFGKTKFLNSAISPTYPTVSKFETVFRHEKNLRKYVLLL